MIPMVEIKTFQFEQLNRQLEGLQTDLKIKARKRGLLDMANPVAYSMRAGIPTRTGALKRSIGHQWIRNEDMALTVGSVKKVADGINLSKMGSGLVATPRRRLQAYKMHWLEEGTDRHMLRAWKDGQRMTTAKIRKANDAGIILKRAIVHPGIRARWIQRNAFELNAPMFLDYFTRGAARALAKYGVTPA